MVSKRPYALAFALSLSVFALAPTGAVAFPYGGSCQKSDPKILTKVNAAFGNGTKLGFSFQPQQHVCERNIAIVERDGEPALRIATGRGDGIGNTGRKDRSGWSDIKQGDRRRFELLLHQKVRDRQPFRFEFSVRVPEDMQFMAGDSESMVDESEFYIFQLKSPVIGAPVISAKVSRSQGINLLGFKVQKPDQFGEWVKLRVEFRPSAKEDGFTRLWVNDELLMDETGYATVWSKEKSGTYRVKFGIYQLNRDPKRIKADTIQAMEFKDFSFAYLKK